jgi:FlaA1/EpsC-like NDP-sugar epimerase
MFYGDCSGLIYDNGVLLIDPRTCSGDHVLNGSNVLKWALKNQHFRLFNAYALDLMVFAASAALAFLLRFDGRVPAIYYYPLEITMIVGVLIKAAMFVAAKLNRGNWRCTTSYDAARLVLSITVASLSGAFLIVMIVGAGRVPRSIYILDWLIACLLSLGMRLFMRVLATTNALRRKGGANERTLIYGAGAAGMALLLELNQNPALKFHVVGFIDDDPSKVHLHIYGKRVLGSGDTLTSVVRSQNVEKVLIAIPSASGPQMSRIIQSMIDADVEYKTIPGMTELIQGAELGKQIRSVAVDDLLGRQPVRLDMNAIRSQISGKVVMVTGAAGSIGSELCRQIAHFKPLALVGFDVAETPLFQIDRELKQNHPALMFHPEIGNIAHVAELELVMEQYKPSVLFHAAAYKHVPLMEKHVFAAVVNNIFGTWNVATVASKYGVRDFVLISTDKAVRPTSLMGATKRVAELLIGALQEESETCFVAVRFGNVLGSNGSVVPIFKEQIAAGGPITVTHPDITRYFMTIPEAAQLVLQSFSLGKGGEVFVLDMGAPVKIVDLARNLILLSGLSPDRDIHIHYTGLRPGEKLYEELSQQGEQLVLTAHSKIKSYVGNVRYDYRQIERVLEEIQTITGERDVPRLVSILRKLIPDYCPGQGLLELAVPRKAVVSLQQASMRPNEFAIPARETGDLISQQQ